VIKLFVIYFGNIVFDMQFNKKELIISFYMYIIEWCKIIDFVVYKYWFK